MKNESHEAITFDFQKNLPMPNLTTNVYYRRLLSLYSFNIPTLSTGHSKQKGKIGSDKVTSFLYNFIFILLDPKVKNIELFCDGCARQNKKFTVLRFLHYVVHAARKLDRIKLTFPVRGHSYLECDWNMVRTNQKYPAEIPEHRVEVFESAHTKPFPYYVVNVDQAL
ncbi:hypothetical protein PR048_001192 [Dryococelus australis]|uniref:Uncharacterized protein n=1 Tax=Dryococelus australis TaxID=614101 RepID=A0ABQ9IJ37_9NEOP|nr:hypothetical protein PR048_001192 [Dryococelus australis]